MNEELNSLLHQPVRTRLMAYLINVDFIDYTTLKKDLELTDGHMSTHMKQLISAGLVEMKKEFINNKPKTTYKITKQGKIEFLSYLNELKKIIIKAN